MTADEIAIYATIFFVGMLCGSILKHLYFNKGDYVGTIRMIGTRDKALYNLELDTNPEMMMYQKRVIFKVDASELDV